MTTEEFREVHAALEEKPNAHVLTVYCRWFIYLLEKYEVIDLNESELETLEHIQEQVKL